MTTAVAVDSGQWAASSGQRAYIKGRIHIDSSVTDQLICSSVNDQYWNPFGLSLNDEYWNPFLESSIEVPLA